ncbi:MAG TPA: extracellular solute-binding protein [Mesorhizobium sp.]
MRRLILAFAAFSLLGTAARADDRQTKACPSPQQVQGFATCADIAKAQEEGEVVLYSPAPEPGTVKLLEEFHRLFPKIKTSYVRLQSGALYARLMRERQSGSFLADVLHLSDTGLVLDFQNHGGYGAYVSPQDSAYKSEYKSKPEGLWTWGAVIMAGIAYNPKILAKDEAPKDWADLTNPRWAGKLSVKSSNSGLQLLAWDLLGKKLGDGFWPKIAELKPTAFDSYVQQFDRIVNGDDEVAVTAQYSGYLLYKQKGAPIEMVLPPSGLPAGPEVWGVIKEASHPEAARLFLDWFLSPLGQRIQADYVFLHSPRADVAPPPGGVPISELNLLLPTDWSIYTPMRAGFVKTWNKMTGLR